MFGTVNVNSFPFSKSEIGQITQDPFAKKAFPVVYILYNTDTQMAYVGETTNAVSRMASHLAHKDKSKLKCVYIISSETFNKSAALDIESNLIQYMTASNQFKLLNANGGVANHEYYQKEEYFKVFKEVWSKLSFENIKLQDLLELQNSDLFKYSPYKSLSVDQYQSILEILESFTHQEVNHVFVDGSAGTGKTILAIYLIKLLATLSHYEMNELDVEDENLMDALIQFKKHYPAGLQIGFVVPMTSLRTTLSKVFKSIHGLSGTMVIGPTDVVKKNYDLIIVDEAHRLTRRKSIMGYGSFDNINKKLGLYHTEKVNGKDFQDVEKNGTQLDWILRKSKLNLFFYDAEQSIKPADIRASDFEKIKKLPNAKQIHLVSQMRSKGGTGYLQFVDQLLRTSENVQPFSDNGYELVIYEQLPDLIRDLQEKENQFGLCRSMSGYSWPWVSKNDKSLPDAIIDGVDLFWNRTSTDWINSTTQVTEMGCIHTVQGYDLNYAGIIFGEEIDYDPETGKIIVDKSKYFDAKGKQAVNSTEELLEYIIKIYKTMMFRGIMGTFLYVCNPKLRQYFSKYIPVVESTPKLEIVSHGEVNPFIDSLPLVDIYAAAGEFSELQISEQREWVKIPENIRLHEKLFVCQIIGESMNKRIPNGSYCIFEKYSGGSRNGQIVLVEHYNIQEADFGAGYTVKEYYSSKKISGEGWQHTTIELKPLSNDDSFEVIKLKEDELEHLKVLGVFKKVLK